MITIQQLITVAPFADDVKRSIMSALPTLSDDKKFELEELCWSLISQWYQNEIQIQSESMIIKIAKGEKNYTREEIKKVPDKLFSELVKQLASEESKEDLDQVRQKLADVLNKPTE